MRTAHLCPTSARLGCFHGSWKSSLASFTRLAPQWGGWNNWGMVEPSLSLPPPHGAIRFVYRAADFREDKWIWKPRLINSVSSTTGYQREYRSHPGWRESKSLHFLVEESSHEWETVASLPRSQLGMETGQLRAQP